MQFKLFSQILEVLPRSDRKKIFFVTLLQICLNFLDLVGIGLIGILGALAVTGVESGKPGNRVSAALKFLGLGGKSLQAQVTIIGICAGLLLIFRTIISIWLSKKTLKFISRRSAYISSELIRSLFSKNLLEIQNYTQAEIVFNVTSGVQNLTLGVVGTAVTLITDACLLLVLSIGLFAVDPVITVVVSIVFLTIGFVLHRIMKNRAFKLGTLEQQLGIRSNQKIVEFLDAYRELTVKNCHASYIKGLSDIRYSLADVYAEKTFMPNISKYVVETVVVLGSLIIGAVQFSLQDAAHAVASLSIFLAAGSRIAPAALRIQQGAIQIKNSLGMAERTLEMIQENTRSSYFSRLLEFNSSVDFTYEKFEPKVSIRNLSVTYSGKKSPALDNINLDIESGQVVALVGPSGAGKSTLVDVILGIFPPTSGTIKLSNLKPSQSFELWPGAVSYVPQNITIVMGSVRENIALGLEPSTYSDESFWEALRNANIENFVKSLPKGLDTQVGDNGAELSGGQRQRLGIARALFTKPKMLILDEATSALDVDNEAAIADLINTLSGNTSVITIAHRLSSVRKSDRIIYLDSGKIIAEGTFNELRAKVSDFDRQAGLMGL